MSDKPRTTERPNGAVIWLVGSWVFALVAVIGLRFGWWSL